MGLKKGTIIKFNNVEGTSIRYELISQTAMVLRDYAEEELTGVSIELEILSGSFKGHIMQGTLNKRYYDVYSLNKGK